MLQCHLSPDVFSYSALSSAWAKKGRVGNTKVWVLGGVKTIDVGRWFKTMVNMGG